MKLSHLGVIVAVCFGVAYSRSLRKRQASLGIIEKNVVCYYTNWSVYRQGNAKFTPKDINPYLCTHLIYAFVTFNEDGDGLKPFDEWQDISLKGFKEFVDLKKYNENLKTMVALGGWREGSRRFSEVCSTQEKISAFAKNVISFLREHKFDGINFDWQFPGDREGSRPEDKANYVQLMKTLQEEFVKEAELSKKPRLLSAVGVPSELEFLERGFDIKGLCQYIDLLNVVSYDYHFSYEPYVNHHAPLFPLIEETDDTPNYRLNVDFTINKLINDGAPKEKIMLGIPTYGRSFTLEDSKMNHLGSPSSGEGEEGDLTRESGYMAYFEICKKIKEDGDWTVRHPNKTAMGPYAFKDDVWVGFDDEDIARKKGEYAGRLGLGGVMFWTIDDDDFRGECHDRSNPILKAAREGLLSAWKENSSRTSRPQNVQTVTDRPSSTSASLIEEPDDNESFGQLENANFPDTSEVYSGGLSGFNFSQILPSILSRNFTNQAGGLSFFSQNIRVWVFNNIFHLDSPQSSTNNSS